MKDLVRSAARLLFVVLFLGLSVPLIPRPAAAAVAPSCATKKEKDYKVKKGPEVAARVHALKASNENVRAALRYFETKGRAVQS